MARGCGRRRGTLVAPVERGLLNAWAAAPDPADRDSSASCADRENPRRVVSASDAHSSGGALRGQASGLGWVREWLRVGGGYDRPFGREHDPSSVEAARHLGEESLREIAAIDLSPGLRQRV